jgi:TolA-binding protein
MNNLKELFVESYIEVPESKVDLVDELAASVEELEEKLNDQTGSVLEMREKLEEYQRETVIRESARDLADTQVEKLRSLVSSLDFEDEESFTEKVKTVKESYFKKEVTSTEEVIEEDWDTDATVESNSTMDMYLNAIKRTKK